MRTVTVFNSVSLDGYFTDAKGDMSWAHKQDPEFNEFTHENAQGEGLLVFGRITYDLMTQYWPTPAAMKNDPVTTEQINSAPKIVFSRTLDKATWNNTTLLKGDPVAAIRRMKQESGPDIVIMGSGTIIAQLAPAGLIDEYKLIVNPLVLGKGRTMFEGMNEKIPLKRTTSREFKNGNVLLVYESAA
jgi:dihydrofolate reductase